MTIKPSNAYQTYICTGGEREFPFSVVAVLGIYRTCTQAAKNLPLRHVFARFTTTAIEWIDKKDIGRYALK